MKHFELGKIGLCVATSLGLLLFSGCNSEHSHVDDHHHDEEPKTAQITVWGERHEIFAEHRLVVAGRPTKFVTHVTDLKTLEPRREGQIKFILRAGQDAPIERIEAAPSRAGIYEAMLTFPKAGDWAVFILIPTDEGEKTIALPPVKVFADDHDAAHAPEPEAPDGISFLKEQQWKILSRTEPAAKRHMVERVRVVARVRAKPGFSVTITAPVSGQLMAPPGQPLPEPGHWVAAGQLLALLRPNFSEAATKVAEAEAEFKTSKAALVQAETAYNRVRRLAGVEAKSPRELQEAELAHQSAMARYAAASGLLATFKQTEVASSPEAPLLMELRTPIPGVLNTMAAGPGDVVAANQPVLTVLNLKSVWIEANIPESNIARLSTGKDALFELPGESGEFIPITGEGRGRFISLGLEVEASTRTVPLIYEVINPDSKLRVGQNLTLQVETAREEDTVAIPESAIVEEGDQLVSFVQVSGETFEKREVKAGLRDAGFVQVLDGIQEGDRVVTKGAYAIRLSSLSGVIPAHGHAH